ncbi:hypothetical protein WN51_01630 [Melipona quadrifasciata]|uniref:Uncharacterized protein n=1 Tax=Melipona quadrifasciata TaxID=166423 RepID=A0A0M8ZUQ7_9HYME|nr:hypothetical protein WN51_01630 [Melipona quadrifasciata]
MLFTAIQSRYFIVVARWTGAKSSARVVDARYPVEPVFVDPPRIENPSTFSPFLLRRAPTAVTVLLRVARCRVKNNTLPDIYSNSEGVRGREIFEKEQPQPRRGGSGGGGGSGGRSIQQIGDNRKNTKCHFDKFKSPKKNVIYLIRRTLLTSTTDSEFLCIYGKFKDTKNAPSENNMRVYTLTGYRKKNTEKPINPYFQIKNNKKFKKRIDLIYIALCCTIVIVNMAPFLTSFVFHAQILAVYSRFNAKLTTSQFICEEFSKLHNLDMESGLSAGILSLMPILKYIYFLHEFFISPTLQKHIYSVKTELANRRDTFSPSDAWREQSYNVGNRPMDPGVSSRRARKHTQTQRYDEDNEERSFEGITYKMTRELASYVYRIIANNTRLIYPVQLDSYETDERFLSNETRKTGQKKVTQTLHRDIRQSSGWTKANQGDRNGIKRRIEPMETTTLGDSYPNFGNFEAVRNFLRQKNRPRSINSQLTRENFNTTTTRNANKIQQNHHEETEALNLRPMIPSKGFTFVMNRIQRKEKKKILTSKFKVKTGSLHQIEDVEFIYNNHGQTSLSTAVRRKDSDLETTKHDFSITCLSSIVKLEVFTSFSHPSSIDHLEN